jgi:hypothetical protein
MWKGAGNACQSSAFANSDLVIEAVDLAVTRANATGPQCFDGFDGTLLKNTGLECADVRRNEMLARQQKSAVASQLDWHRQIAPAFDRAIKGIHPHEFTSLRRGWHIAAHIRRPRVFSGERTRLACRRWRLVNDFLLTIGTYRQTGYRKRYGFRAWT